MRNDPFGNCLRQIKSVMTGPRPPMFMENLLETEGLTEKDKQALMRIVTATFDG